MRRCLALLIALMALLCSSGGPFRLHVLANSNSAADQAVKLKVRDAILRQTGADMRACTSKSEAERYMKEHLPQLEETARAVLREEGFSYGATAEIGRYPFPEKSYAGVTYPAGDYDALRVRLGAAEGDNWWCVLFPPLCIVDLQERPEEIKVDSALLRWLRGLLNTEDEDA